MSKTEHTPTPWKYDTNPRIIMQLNDPCHIVDICRVYGPFESDEADANAAFIVRACNSHDALVEALKECITEEGALCLTHDDKKIMRQRLAYITETARAALQAAKG